jgi:hypothetical protein
LHSHPLTTPNKSLEEGRCCTSSSLRAQRSDIVTSLLSNPFTNMSYADPKDDSYGSIASKARVSQLFRMARANLMGERADIGAHKKVDIR